MRIAVAIVAVLISVLAIPPAQSSIGRLGAAMGKLGAAAGKGSVAPLTACTNVSLDFTDSRGCNATLIGAFIN